MLHPRNEIENKLCEVWAQVLGLERVGTEDNFFAIGGDSILSLRVLARARAAGVRFGVDELFRNLTIAQLATVIAARSQESPVALQIAAFELLTPGERAQFANRSDIDDDYPLSLLQQGMYFHSEMEPDSAVYHDIFSYGIEAVFHREHFERAVQSLVQRHAVLRTGFVMGCEHRLLQVVHRSVAVGMQVEDVSHLSLPEQDGHIAKRIEQEKSQRFAWSQPPLLRIFVQVRGERRFQYTLGFHHIILDGWSVASLQTELLGHYASLLAARERVIDPPRAMYRDFIAREHQALESTRSPEYWRELLAGASLPLLPRCATVTKLKGAEVAAVNLDFDLQIGQRLELCAAARYPSEAAAPDCTRQGHERYFRQQEVLTGLVSHGRLEEEDGERVLGLHLNTLPLRLAVAPGSWKDLVKRVGDLEGAIQPHRHFPLAAIHALVEVEQLFDTLFNFIRSPPSTGTRCDREGVGTETFEQTNPSLLATFSQEPSGAVSRCR